MRAAVLVAIVLLLAPIAAASPPFRATDFVMRVDNPWFPLTPGTVYVYRGIKDGKPSRDVVTVSRATRMIEGVKATSVHDDLYVEGRLEERTTDWYAQDRAGNVWYFGEATKELDSHGRVTTREGSWEDGRHGAEAGVFMPAHPRVGQSFRQEYYAGHADDHFKIVALRETSLTTHEWTPLEPGVLDQKVYRRGTGTTSEDSLKGGSEHLHLVSQEHG